ncbi:unnamed protein product, partial [Symbiodinium sp. CCMP2456]
YVAAGFCRRAKHITKITRPYHQQLATFTFGKLAAILQRQQFPVACWRDGATHYPVQGFIPIQHPRWNKSAPKSQPKIDVNKLISDMKLQTPPPPLVQLREAVDKGIANHAWTNMEQLEEGLLASAQELYAVEINNSQEPAANRALAQCARDMWAIFRAMRTHPFTARGIVQAWRQWKDFMRKLPRPGETCIRHGHIMTPESELNWIVEAFGQRYGARSPQWMCGTNWNIYHYGKQCPRSMSSGVNHNFVFNKRGPTPRRDTKFINWFTNGRNAHTLRAGESLELAHIDPFVQEILLQWLGQVRYKFRHKGMEKEVWWVIAIFRRMGMQVNTHKTKATEAPAPESDAENEGDSERSVPLLQTADQRRSMLPDIKPEMMPDEEMDEFFGSIKPSEEMGEQENRRAGEQENRYRGGEAPVRNTPFGPFSTPNKRRRNPFEDKTPFYTTPPPYSQPHHHRGQDRDPLVFALAKTVLKQQEELRVLRQDTAFIMFMKPGQDSILHHLYSTAVAFKAKQEADPTWQLGQQPLRMVLAQALFREVVNRLNSTIASQERLRRVMDQGWRDATGWRYQVWNPRARQLEVDQSRPPIPEDKLLDHLATIIQCLKHPILTRFHCTRKMTETMAGQATYKMDLSLRSHSALTMWDEMRMLQGNAVFQLVGLGYKVEGLGRGPMEQRIMDMMYGRR